MSVSDPPPMGPTVTLRLWFHDWKLCPEDSEGRVWRDCLETLGRLPSTLLQVQHSIHILGYGLLVLSVLEAVPDASDALLDKGQECPQFPQGLSGPRLK
jgi:hypothetical protein